MTSGKGQTPWPNSRRGLINILPHNDKCSGPGDPAVWGRFCHPWHGCATAPATPTALALPQGQRNRGTKLEKTHFPSSAAPWMLCAWTRCPMNRGTGLEHPQHQGVLPRRLFPEIPAPAESPIPTPNPPSPSSPAVASLAGGGPMCHGDRDLGMAREPHEMLSALQLWPHSPALSWTNSCGRRGFSKGRTMGLDAATCFACSRG